MKTFSVLILNLLIGLQSAVDVFGVNFKRHYRKDTVYNSWSNVGDFFTKGFDNYKQLHTSSNNKMKLN